VAAVRRFGSLEDRVVPWTLEAGMRLVEGDQVGERLRIWPAARRGCACDVSLQVGGDIGLELAVQRLAFVLEGGREVDIGRVDDRCALRLERRDRGRKDRLDDRAGEARVVGVGSPD